MIITGSTIYNHFSHPCLYRVHLDLFGDKAERSKPSAAGRYLMERGNRHEVDVFSHLKEKHPEDCIEISRDPDLGHEEDIQRRIEATEEAMRSGVRFIMHGFLTSQAGDFKTVIPGKTQHDTDFCFRGETDLLERRDDLQSEFGDFAYVVGDVKSSRNAKFGQKMQVAFYSALLEKYQGLFPPTGFIITGDAKREEFSTEDLKWILRLFLEEEIAECVDGDSVSFHFGPRCRFCHWRGHCEKKAENTDDLSLVPGCRPAEKRALVAAGIPDRNGLMAQTESDLRSLGRRYGNRLDGFRDLKQKAGAQQFGMAIMRQDPRDTMLSAASAGLGAPCIFRHRGPILLVDAIPDRFHGDEAMLGFSLVRPRDREAVEGSISFVAADEPGQSVSTLRSIFVELNNNNKLVQGNYERVLMVFVDPSLPYRLRRQAGSLWQQHASVPTSIERLLSESAILTETVERTYHLPIDSFDLGGLQQVLSKQKERTPVPSPLDLDALKTFCHRQGRAKNQHADEALEKMNHIFADYGIDPTTTQPSDPSDLDAIFVREWRLTKDDSFGLLMQFNLHQRLQTAHSILRIISRLTQ
ncbi:MAG: hypothetical protein ACI97A_003796 [Planctomycetota bacterium]|jgi:hypothetical protein